jgi:hypothetical protein
MIDFNNSDGGGAGKWFTVTPDATAAKGDRERALLKIARALALGAGMLSLRLRPLATPAPLPMPSMTIRPWPLRESAATGEAETPSRGVNRTALYRHWSAQGELLYVGISMSAAARTAQHSKSARWFEQVHSITVEFFDTREEASAAERIAIVTERPRFNVAMNIFGGATSDAVSRDPRTAPHFLTVKSVEALPVAGESYFVRDSGAGALGGFAVRVYPSGKKTFTLLFRIGRERKSVQISVADHPEVTPQSARLMATMMKSQARSGVDPRSETAKTAVALQMKMLREAGR